MPLSSGFSVPHSMASALTSLFLDFILFSWLSQPPTTRTQNHEFRHITSSVQGSWWPLTSWPIFYSLWNLSLYLSVQLLFCDAVFQLLSVLSASSSVWILVCPCDCFPI
jgi:hypothetical protein